MRSAVIRLARAFIGCLVLLVPPAFALTASEVTPASPVIMRGPASSALVLQDASGSLTVEQALMKTAEFRPASVMPKPDSSATYWVMQAIESRLDEEREIRVAPGGGRGWRHVQVFVLDPAGKVVRIFGSAGVMRAAHNQLAEQNPLRDAAERERSQYPVFVLPRGASLKILLRLQPDHLYVGAGYAASFVNHARYLEMRRLGLYIEGGLAGAVLALCIFGWFSAAQNKDKTGTAYAIWMTVALLSSATQFVHDGQRFFEFFVDIENLTFNGRFLSEFITNSLAMAQAMTYVYFARCFLEIRERFPGFYVATNAYLVFYGIAWIDVALVEIRGIPSAVVITPILVATVLVLVGLLVCAIIRLREGMDVARFFIIAIVPYLIFRTIFLTNLLGYPSPFSFLPDTGIGFFIKESTTAQAFGVALETVIMALAVITRTRWLQEQLATQVLQQKALVENQNKLLEATVAERTRELAERHRELDASYQVVAGSVNYAGRLQRSQLPSQHRIRGRFASLGTVWEPRDTIGGDLWWLSSSQVDGPFSLAIGDCTGHGVPGAMLSLLVCNSLDRIYSGDPHVSPSDALMSIDHLVRTALNQDASDSESDDGCDAAILRIDLARRRIDYAGAKISLFQLHADGRVERHAASRGSLGYRAHLADADKPVTKSIPVADGDAFVLVTDGFTDQPGGPGQAPVSYGYRRLERLLASMHTAPAEQIAARMISELRTWQGQRMRRDDVTAIVFRLPQLAMPASSANEKLAEACAG